MSSKGHRKATSVYATARLLRDLEAIANGTYFNRLFNRALAKAAGKALRPHYRRIRPR